MDIQCKSDTLGITWDFAIPTATILLISISWITRDLFSSKVSLWSLCFSLQKTCPGLYHSIERPRTYRNSFEKFKILFRKGEGGPGTFDIERTCRELGEWCNDPAGVSGRLDCSHCDSYDRLNNKCPECIRGAFIPFWYELLWVV